jgi:hypothetical protein
VQASCGENLTTIYYDELLVFDSFEDPSAVYHAKCGTTLSSSSLPLYSHCIALNFTIAFLLVQIPPMPMFANVAQDHSNFTVTYNSFFAQYAAEPPSFEFQLYNGSLSVYKTDSYLFYIYTLTQSFV